MQDLKNVTFETNTTQSLHPEFKEYSQAKQDLKQHLVAFTQFLENLDTAIKPDIAYDYYSVPGSSMYFKFVVSDSTDVNDVDRVKQYNTKDIDVPVYLMPWVVEVKNTILQSKMWQNLHGERMRPTIHITLFGMPGYLMMELHLDIQMNMWKTL